MTRASTLPDHYPFAIASWEEKLSWLDAEQPPYERMREAIPWLHTDEQLGWWIEGLRDAIAHPQRAGALAQLLTPALARFEARQ